MVDVSVDGNIFTFPSTWAVELYDTWPIVARLAGGLGTKACDIVAVNDKTLYLIEAKDYTSPPGTRPPKLPELAETVAVKGLHTLAGLLAGTQLDTDKREFCRRAVECERIELYLSVELPADKGRLYSQSSILVSLRELLSKKTRPYLSAKPVVVSNHIGRAPWVSVRDVTKKHR